jgi:hypothetical protein
MIINTLPLFNNLLTKNQHFSYLCPGVSLLRPAPLELPQGGNAARVESCSGAIKVAYPFYFNPICTNQRNQNIKAICHQAGSFFVSIHLPYNYARSLQLYS